MDHPKSFRLGLMVSASALALAIVATPLTTDVKNGAFKLRPPMLHRRARRLRAILPVAPVPAGPVPIPAPMPMPAVLEPVRRGVRVPVPMTALDRPRTPRQMPRPQATMLAKMPATPPAVHCRRRLVRGRSRSEWLRPRRFCQRHCVRHLFGGRHHHERRRGRQRHGHGSRLWTSRGNGVERSYRSAWLGDVFFGRLLRRGCHHRRRWQRHRAFRCDHQRVGRQR